MPNPNSDDVNLEHILPNRPHVNWPRFTDEQRKAMYPRLGNLVLMRSEDNSVAGNAKFTDKKKLLKKSSFKLTKSVAKNGNWGEQEIVNRQTVLANLAVKTWSGKFE